MGVVTWVIIVCLLLFFGKGFCQQLNCTFQLTDASGTIMAPDFDDDGTYEPNLDCTWRIKAAQDHIIILDILFMDIEIISDECAYDWLRVFDGETELGRFCGTMDPGTLYSSGGDMTVLFGSDATEQLEGFRIYYFQFKDGGCELQVTKPLGIIKTFDTNGDGLYENVDIIWHFEHERATLQISFTSLDIPSSSTCDIDYLKVYDNNVLHGVYCNLRPPELITSDSSYTRLQFHSQGRNSGRGFTAVHKLQIAGSEAECGGLVVEPEGEIRTLDTDGDGHYENLLNCLWVIVAPEYYQIKLSFHEFDIEFSLVCSFDVLRLYDGLLEYFIQESSFSQYCGIELPVPVYSTSNILVVYFESDGTSTGLGFIASYMHIGGNDIHVRATPEVAQTVGSTTKTTTTTTDHITWKGTTMEDDTTMQELTDESSTTVGLQTDDPTTTDHIIWEGTTNEDNTSTQGHPDERQTETARYITGSTDPVAPFTDLTGSDNTKFETTEISQESTPSNSSTVPYSLASIDDQEETTGDTTTDQHTLINTTDETSSSLTNMTVSKTISWQSTIVTLDTTTDPGSSDNMTRLSVDQTHPYSSNSLSTPDALRGASTKMTPISSHNWTMSTKKAASEGSTTDGYVKDIAPINSVSFCAALVQFIIATAFIYSQT